MVIKYLTTKNSFNCVEKTRKKINQIQEFDEINFNKKKIKRRKGYLNDLCLCLNMWTNITKTKRMDSVKLSFSYKLYICVMKIE